MYKGSAKVLNEPVSIKFMKNNEKQIHQTCSGFVGKQEHFTSVEKYVKKRKTMKILLWISFCIVRKALNLSTIPRKCS